MTELGDILREVRDGKMKVTQENVWGASNFQSLIQMLDARGNVLVGRPKMEDVVSFRLTRRGQDVLKQSEQSQGALPFDKADPPISIRLWVSAFRRWCRNAPKGLHMTYSDGQLRILVADNQGKVVDDDIHRLASMKVPWLE